MHCLHCYAAAQHLSAARRKSRNKRGFVRATLLAHRYHSGLRKDGEEGGDVEEGEGNKRVRWGWGEGSKKMNGQAEGAASMGKLDNECLSLASMMDEWGMVFVTNAIFFESLRCFPAEGRGWQAGTAAPCLSSSSVALIVSLTFNDPTIKHGGHGADLFL